MEPEAKEEVLAIEYSPAQGGVVLKTSEDRIQDDMMEVLGSTQPSRGAPEVVKSLSDDFDILDQPKGILDALDEIDTYSSGEENFSDIDENADEIHTVKKKRIAATNYKNFGEGRRKIEEIKGSPFL